MADRQHRRTKQPQSSPEQDFIEAIFRGIGQLIGFLFKMGKKGPGKDERSARFAQIREHWQDVELHLLRPETQALAISEADKLMDAAFLAYGAPGNTMGERLKSSESWFAPAMYQEIWQAHKLRNFLAHEVGATVSPTEAKEVVSHIRNAMYHLQILS